MPAPVFLDLSHTSHTRARTGIQRVARALRRELSDGCEAVTFDPYENIWRPLRAWEEKNLMATDPAPGRGSRWPLSARLAGRWRLMTMRAAPLAWLPRADGGVIVPEIFSAEVAKELPGLFAANTGPRVALFHDGIALQYPEFTPRSTSARFPSYLRELLQFDGVAAVSEASRDCLLEYWTWLGVSKVPQVAAIPLGIDAAPPAPVRAPGAVPVLLCVGSIEGRKNHAALLDACESLWARDVRFELRLIGLANTETGAGALAKIEKLRSAGRPIRYDGPASDAMLEAAYGECAFTVYPSLSEGFGLPVAESLARGRVCLCRMEGALGEIARGGGCASLGAAGPADIASAVRTLLASPFDLASLEAAARARRFKDWAQYLSQLRAWMGTLRRNA
jgi:glycosyltransferase involved in cell wall biosynthesis